MIDEFNTQEDDDLTGEPSLDSLAPEVEEDEADSAGEEGDEILLTDLKKSDVGDEVDEEDLVDEDEDEDDMELLGSEDWEQ